MTDKKEVTLESVVEYLPDGDFKLQDDFAGDWSAYQCGEHDCERQWHKNLYAVDHYRKDGNLLIEVRSCDEDGNWDYVCGYDESAGDTWENSEVKLHLETNPDEFFQGWRDYAQYVIDTGKDPLGEFYVQPTYKVKERWEIWLHKSIAGIALNRVRRSKCLPMAAYLLPDYMRQFLQLKSDNLHLDLTLEDCAREGIPLRKWHPITVDVTKERAPGVYERELKKRARKALRSNAA